MGLFQAIDKEGASRAGASSHINRNNLRYFVEPANSHPEFRLTTELCQDKCAEQRASAHEPAACAKPGIDPVRFSAAVLDFL
jgi:hypothetical protein